MVVVEADEQTEAEHLGEVRVDKRIHTMENVQGILVSHTSHTSYKSCESCYGHSLGSDLRCHLDTGAQGAHTPPQHDNAGCVVTPGRIHAV